MFIIEGKHGTAACYAVNIEEKCVEQIRGMLDMPFAEGANTAIMPDAHYGIGCTIGTTMKVTDAIVPNLVDASSVFHTVHNYIDTDEMVLRKGAIAAHAGETVLIPLNMRDGSIIARGRGNEAWNNSAPHGAGRVMSRGDAREKLALADYEADMKGVYSTSVSKATIDEAPAAYKPIDDIIGPIAEAVDIVDVMKPIYNFKAS